jgi:hypothetical protein
MRTNLNALDIRAELLRKVEAYLVKNDLSVTRFGYMSTGDPCLVSKLRRGGDIRLRTLEKIMQFMLEKRS